MPNGQIATTEYSASTGGYTSSANQQSPFTAVPDDGDAVCVPGACNPNHHWTTSVSDAAMQNAWPQIGTFTGLRQPTSDPGHPYDFPHGRVDTITLDGSTGSDHRSRDRVLRRPRPQFGSLHGDLDQRRRPSPSPARAGVTASGWASGARSATPSVRTTATGTGPTADREPLLRPGPAGQPAGRRSSVGGRAAGSAGTGSTPPTAASSASATRSSTAAPGGMRLNQPVVGMASTHDAGGLLGGRLRRRRLQLRRRPVPRQHRAASGSTSRWSAWPSTPDGGGYWLVASDGGIFAYGDAGFYGSTGSLVLNKPVIGMVPTHDGGGYWLIASDGGRLRLRRRRLPRLARRRRRPPTPHRRRGAVPRRRRLLDARGQRHRRTPSATRRRWRSPASRPALGSMTSPMTGLIPDFSGQGFDAVDGSGQAFAYGDAPYFGDVTTAVPGYSGHAVGIAATPG